MQTNSERDERVMKIVSQARRQSPAEREPFLRSACETDSNLYQEIAETLEWEDRMGSFLQQPLVALTVVGRPFRPGEVIEGRFDFMVVAPYNDQVALLREVARCRCVGHAASRWARWTSSRDARPPSCSSP